MANTIVCKTDKEGGMIVPKEILELLGVYEGDVLEVKIEKENLILSKYKEGCMFCGTEEDIIQFQGSQVCKTCVKSVDALFETAGKSA